MACPIRQKPGQKIFKVRLCRVALAQQLVQVFDGCNNKKKGGDSMTKIIKLFFAWLFGVAFGYFWCYMAFNTIAK